MRTSLKDKVVLITGASSGFGADAARAFAHEGARVVLAARRLDRLQELAAEIQNTGGSAIAVPVDVANRADISNMVKTVIDLYGRIDILFNNAGFGRLDWFENLDPERDIETQVDVNLLGVMQVTRAVLPHMILQRSGHIINMSSIAGWIAAPLYGVYAATKFAVRGFSDGLRREVTPFGIKVSGVYPGIAHTEFSEHTGNHILKTKKIQRPFFLKTTSLAVAKGVVRIAKYPRRNVIIPRTLHAVIWLEHNAPWLIDGVLSVYMKKYRPVNQELKRE